MSAPMPTSDSSGIVQPVVRIAGRSAMFDGMVWPIPDSDTEWRLRYAPESITRQDQLYLASVVAAYWALFTKPRIQREFAIRHVRAAMNQPASHPEKASVEDSLNV
jgi:hypothetical protein